MLDPYVQTRGRPARRRLLSTHGTFQKYLSR
jgi:hypothetical protein